MTWVWTGVFIGGLLFGYGLRGVVEYRRRLQWIKKVVGDIRRALEL